MKRLLAACERPAGRGVVICAVIAAGLVWLLFIGRVYVVRGSVQTGTVVPLWYNLAAFPVLGMLVADWVVLLSRHGWGMRTLELGVQIALLTGISAVRVATGIPISGHALLMGYFLTRRMVVGPLSPWWARTEVFVAAGLLGLTAHRKLVVWDDPLTLCTGLGLGCVLALVSYLVWRRRDE